MPFALLDTLAGLELAKGGATEWSVMGRKSRDQCFCCLLWFLAGRRKPVSDVKVLPVASVTLLGCQASVLSSSIAHFSLSSQPHSLVGWL